MLYFRIFFLLVFSMVLFSCEPTQSEDVVEEPFELICDAEEIFSGDIKLLASSIDNIGIRWAKHRSDSISRSGKYSLRTSKDAEYSFSTVIENVKIDDHYKISAWRYGSNSDTRLVVSGEGFYFADYGRKVEGENGWELMEVDLYIPPNIGKKEVKVFVWNAAGKPTYIDDLKIVKVFDHFPNYEGKAIQLFLDDQPLEKLEEIRIDAFNKGILQSSDDSYVKAIIFYGDQELKAKVRFKGDWLDHLRGDKWSFRVKLSKGKTLNGMRTFNIQNPLTRNFADEWVIHKIAEQNDILTTRYEFVPVYINGKSLGLYAIEEHFEKQLVESKNRREGPILKFTEDHLWKSRILEMENSFAHFEAAKIQAFKMGKILESEKLSKQFAIARNQMKAFRESSLDPKTYMDIDKTAKLFAFNDLIEGYHGMIWHNLRFYYNPVISKLEPILYDLYTENGVYDAFYKRLVCDFDYEKLPMAYDSFHSYRSMMRDSTFAATYLKYLIRFSEKEFLDSAFQNLQDGITENETLIQKEFPDYSFNKERLYNRQVDLRKDIPKITEKINNGYFDGFNTDFPKTPVVKGDKKDPLMIPELVQIYKEERGYRLDNYYPKKLFLQAYVTKKMHTIQLNNPIEIKAFANGRSSIVVLDSVPDVSEIYLRVDGQEAFIKMSIIPYSAPSNSFPKIASKDPLPEWIEKEGQNLFIRTGSYVIDKPVIIEASQRLVVDAGVQIDFINGAYFWSESAVQFNGTETQPIILQSTDDSAMGFMVMQTQERSVMQHVEFKRFNTFIYNGWELTGAINFYEADVDLNHCSFIDNHCEDALNIIRSDFNVSEAIFENIFADAFDSDFCTGTLTDSRFKVVGNDAIDFSGSTVLIKDCDIDAVSDKGISGGEASTLTVSNCVISHCNVALASKDRSVLVLNNIEVNNCGYGLIAFKKKEEYGAARIEAENVQMERVTKEHLIEKKSELIINGRTIAGTEKKVAKLFY